MSGAARVSGTLDIHQFIPIRQSLDAVGNHLPLGGAGVPVRTLEPALLAEVVAKVATDKKLQAELGERQSTRAAELETFPWEQAPISALWEADGHEGCRGSPVPD